MRHRSTTRLGSTAMNSRLMWRYMSQADASPDRSAAAGMPSWLPSLGAFKEACVIFRLQCMSGGIVHIAASVSAGSPVTALTLFDANSSRVPSSEGCVLLSPETLHAHRLAPGQLVLVGGNHHCTSQSCRTTRCKGLHTRPPTTVRPGRHARIMPLAPQLQECVQITQASWMLMLSPDCPTQNLAPDSSIHHERPSRTHLPHGAAHAAWLSAVISPMASSRTTHSMLT